MSKKALLAAAVVRTLAHSQSSWFYSTHPIYQERCVAAG